MSDVVLNFLGLAHLLDQRLVDVRDHTSTSDGSFYQSVQFFITSDGKLKVPWSNSAHLQIFGSISCQLQNLSSQVFQNRSTVDSSSGTNSAMGTNSGLQESVNSTNRELRIKIRKQTILCFSYLKSCSIGTGHWFSLGTSFSFIRLPSCQLKFT